MNNWKEDEAMGRVMRFAGKTRREVSNPCLSANDTIALANRIARERADAQAEIARLRGALESIAAGDNDGWAVFTAREALK